MSKLFSVSHLICVHSPPMSLISVVKMQDPRPKFSTKCFFVFRLIECRDVFPLTCPFFYQVYEVVIRLGPVILREGRVLNV